MSQEVRKKQFTVYNHEQLDKRKNKRIYEENSIKEIVNKFLLYEENKVINNGKTTNKALINALQILMMKFTFYMIIIVICIQFLLLKNLDLRLPIEECIE